MFHASVSGQGPAVVFLHGFAVSSTVWDHAAAALSDRYRVIVPHLPGHGATPPLPAADLDEEGAAAMERLADGVLAVLDQAGVETAAVAGHSMGGYIALALQQRAANRVAGLGLVATQARADTSEAQAGRRKLADTVAERGAQALAEALLPKLFAADVAAESQLYRDADEFIRSMPVPGIRAALLGMARRQDHRDRLSAVRIPALVVRPDLDRLIPPDRSDELAALLADVTLVSVPDAGHMAPVERPDAVTQALSQWLARVYPPKRNPRS